MPQDSRHERFSFKLDAFTPDTLTMARLSEYLADLADLFGSEESVHFVRVGRGSANLIKNVDREAVGVVRERLKSVKAKTAPSDAMSAYIRINGKLHQDKAKATIAIGRGNVLQFPGRPVKEEGDIGPISQHDSLDGELIRVGGTDATVPVHLREGDQIHHCTTDVEIAKRLAPCLYQPVRVKGIGQWYRRSTGLWDMQEFVIESFSGLDDMPLPEAVRQLRNIKADWVNDPIGFIKDSRSNP